MGIVRPVMNHFPLAWLFFVPFIIITSFAVLNLFIGIIVDAMQMTQQDSRGEDDPNVRLEREMNELRQTMAKLQKTLEASDR